MLSNYYDGSWMQYERWKQQEIIRLRATVPVEKIAEWEKAETAQLIEEHQNPMSFPVLVRVRIETRVEKHFKIPTFEEWKA